jgi:hypothetical protein
VINEDFRRRFFRTTSPVCVLLALVALSAGPAGARSTGRPPEGLTVGRWVLAPYFISQFGLEDNLFRLNSCSADNPDCLDTQRVSRNALGIAARLPVRNSLFELNYQVDKRQYERSDPPRRPYEQMAGALFRFNFGSGDQLVISDTYTRGASDVRAVDEGGEFEFRDQPYDLNRFEVTWSRTIPSRQGFIIRVARVDLNFESPDETSGPVPFFDYRGFDSAFEYRQPMAGRKWLRVYFESRRFNHYEPNAPDLKGIPFRKEVADTLQVGLGGVAGPNKPFNLRIGYGRFSLEGTGAEFKGLLGAADLALLVGGRTKVTFNFWRRPLPSNFDTYYIVNSLRIGAERPFLRVFSGGVSLVHSRSEYGDLLPLLDENDELETEIRKDVRYLLEAYLDWFIHPRLALRLTGGHQQRLSTASSSEFEANAVAVLLRLGWF